MEGNAQQPMSSFSGTKYSPSMNTRTHYKEGNSNGSTKKKSSGSNKKKKNDEKTSGGPKLKGVATVKINPHDKYTETSVFKK